MRKRPIILVLSGSVGVGKSTLGNDLERRFHARRLKTRELIANRRPGVALERGALQAAGDDLDRETGGAWVAEAIVELADEHRMLVVDSVRIASQVNAIRNRFPRSDVKHVHLVADRADLERRFALRDGPIEEPSLYEQVQADQTEAAVNDLGAICDVLIDTSLNRPQDVLVRAAARVGLYHGRPGALVDVLVGAQWGSEGKGHVAWHLAPEYDVLMRVGGPNAGHKTMDPYTFHLLPSGTRVNPRASILIGPGATLNVELLMREIRECDVPPERLSIDPQAMIIEASDPPYESETLTDIGSTAQGGGYAAARRLMRTRMLGAAPVRLARDVGDLAPYVRPTLDALEDAYAHGRRVFVEGTQGSGLSLFHGPFPHTTSRDTNVSGTLSECGIPPHRIRKIVMVTRSYPIRVGGQSGPLPQEIDWDIVAKRAGLDESVLREREHTTTTKRARRVGEFDWEAFRRACSLNAPTDIALSFVDYLDAKNTAARRFEQLQPETIGFIEELERVADASVSLVSTRFHERSIIDRRTW